MARYSIGLPSFEENGGNGGNCDNSDDFEVPVIKIPDPIKPPIITPIFKPPIITPTFKPPIFLKDYMKIQDHVPSDFDDNGNDYDQDNFLKESVDILRDAKDWIRDTDFPKEKEKVYLPPVIQPEKTNFAPLAIGAVALFLLFS